MHPAKNQGNAMISSFIAASIEMALNQALKLEPERAFLLEALQNQRLAVAIADWKVDLLFCPSLDGFKVLSPKPLQGDIVLSGRLFDLAALSLSDAPQSLFATGVVKLEGDAAILQSYLDFFKRLKLDWQGLLEKYIGATATQVLSQTLKKGWHWQQSVCRSNSQDLTEYLHEELRLFPPRGEIEDLYQDIYALRADLERLDARMKLL